MPAEHVRSRATAMGQEQRREAIVQAALPLLSEHGAAVTTRQIATAAGIAEGTVFRAFGDKEELLHACVREAFRTDQLCARIQREARTGADLETRITEAGALAVEHFNHLGQLMRTLITSGYEPHQQHEHGGEAPEDVKARFLRDLSQAIADVLVQDEHQLRVPVDDLARMLLPLLLGTRLELGTGADPRPAVRRRLDVLLHGALATSTNPTGDPHA